MAHHQNPMLEAHAQHMKRSTSCEWSITLEIDGGKAEC
jgi:hypothetical protein